MQLSCRPHFENHYSNSQLGRTWGRSTSKLRKAPRDSQRASSMPTEHLNPLISVLLVNQKMPKCEKSSHCSYRIGLTQMEWSTFKLKWTSTGSKLIDRPMCHHFVFTCLLEKGLSFPQMNLTEVPFQIPFLKADLLKMIIPVLFSETFPSCECWWVFQAHESDQITAQSPRHDI